MIFVIILFINDAEEGKIEKDIKNTLIFNFTTNCCYCKLFKFNPFCKRIKFPVNVIKLQKMTFNQEDIEEPIEIELKMNKNAIIDVR